ncbi:M1 family metallopeptidase [Reichenbachiella sp. MALMAid0571]|uniref:M1 family metallopeptidase n=1 Tax=Reichenbachiella sp. MALMAid0571 TaxID=3143939 RepID=UPI0032DEB703
MKYLGVLFVVMGFIWNIALAQPGRWQQRVEYVMDIDMDVETNRFTGSQRLKYFNNSPDTLFNVYYHLYFNAFQPGSMMDVRSRTIEDPDKRVGDRIFNLKENEQGWHKVISLKQEEKPLKYEVSGTVLEVQLAHPILPNQTAFFEMTFESQVPLQVRRSGRDNKEGIRYSMSQWFPKMAEYDRTGWHTDPYVAREFYSPWGKYNVNISIDKKYVVAATGILQNPKEIGHGYDKPNSKGKSGKNGKLTWQFEANNVHDFVWAADPDYVHDIVKSKTGSTVHFFYQKDTLKENWKDLPKYVSRAFTFLNEKFGEYPYSDYSIIQGGDGAMEYPMATLVTGHRKLSSLTGSSVHEICHNWFPMMLATNEGELPWIDEGFASFAAKLTMSHFPKKEDEKDDFVFKSLYKSYFDLIKSGKDEPLTTHADHFATNKGYVSSSYSKGAVTFNQLGYVIGDEVLFRAFRRLFKDWKFQHPDKEDIIRVFEKESGLTLDWYFDEWINTTNTIDYGLKSIAGGKDKTTVLLERKGEMAMPLELTITLKDGSEKLYYIALQTMRGDKYFDQEVTKLTDWAWVNPLYEFDLPFSLSAIDSIEIDASQGLADIDRTNNVYPFTSDFTLKGEVKK